MNSSVWRVGRKLLIVALLLGLPSSLYEADQPTGVAITVTPGGPGPQFDRFTVELVAADAPGDVLGRAEVPTGTTHVFEADTGLHLLRVFGPEGQLCSVAPAEVTSGVPEVPYNASVSNCGRTNRG